jgi:hypothetical protein
VKNGKGKRTRSLQREDDGKRRSVVHVEEENVSLARLGIFAF